MSGAWPSAPPSSQFFGDLTFVFRQVWMVPGCSFCSDGGFGWCYTGFGLVETWMFPADLMFSARIWRFLRGFGVASMVVRFSVLSCRLVLVVWLVVVVGFCGGEVLPTGVLIKGWVIALLGWRVALSGVLAYVIRD
ncbi:hypothetical protein TSUD_118890 [Trifolium subterraneum]|uniref:Transmembrane protein n=1 Tax=Trifolium subterraneum TaxID=3900 RepID=A0A2Z6N354_TRISU|nr:hypothetical protein TSUD_118890 [Trifolium subterraneum]